ncbi:MAG: sensor domain-containing diguanylate cyclase [Nitrospiraceae bacterium]|nr:MAG: sensor domain-containing diguanylate cyclase [Nitrospiraceae bacterium]
MGHETGQSGGPLFKNFIHSLFRSSIVRKIFFGYFSLAALIVIISVSALSSLERLNKINESIIRRDDQAVEITEKMVDNLLAQELYFRRYFILNSPDMLVLFRERSREFDRMVDRVRMLSGEYAAFAGRLASMHTEYNNLFAETSSMPPSEEHNARIKQKQDELISLIREVSSGAKDTRHNKMIMTERIGNRAFRVTGILCGAGIILSISASLLITRNISRSIRRLKHATEEISEGRFEYKSDTGKQDELGDLSRAFTEMAKRLKLLEEMYLDTNPLTRLPGGSAIEREIKKRTVSGAPSAFCFIDLDNFKAFNDHYSYALGSEVIKATARIIEGAATGAGTHEDFIGHIGGDDFVVITSPERYSLICGAVIERFDKTVIEFYVQEDRINGFITGRNRQGQEMQFPVMTVSIAVVTSREGVIMDPIRIGEIAAELKEYAKSMPGSVCVVDRRQETGQMPPAGNIVQFPGKPGQSYETGIVRNYPA